jgi:ribosome-binding factor A
MEANQYEDHFPGILKFMSIQLSGSLACKLAQLIASLKEPSPLSAVVVTVYVSPEVGQAHTFSSPSVTDDESNSKEGIMGYSANKKAIGSRGLIVCYFNTWINFRKTTSFSKSKRRM